MSYKQNNLANQGMLYAEFLGRFLGLTECAETLSDARFKERAIEIATACREAEKELEPCK